MKSNVSACFSAKSFYNKEAACPRLRLQTLFSKGHKAMSPATDMPSSSCSLANIENIVLMSQPYIRTRSARHTENTTHNYFGASFLSSEYMDIMRRSPHIVLSPIKNVSCIAPLKHSDETLTQTPEMKESCTSLETLDGTLKPSPSSEPACPRLNFASPVGRRRFFRHKSPSSASKAFGGIIIGKGFNLKFVPSRMGRGGKLIQKKTGPSIKNNQTSKRQRVSCRLGMSDGSGKSSMPSSPISGCNTVSPSHFLNAEQNNNGNGEVTLLTVTAAFSHTDSAANEYMASSESLSDGFHMMKSSEPGHVEKSSDSELFPVFSQSQGDKKSKIPSSRQV